MAEYFRKFDTDNAEKYQSSPVVADHTMSLAQSRDYELGYWMQSFMRLFSPGLFFRAKDAFGQLNNWMELRYLMEHTLFDPEHPLYGIDYEICSDEDRQGSVGRIPRNCTFNYICDISCNTHGIAYKGVWTAEISGFSEHFLSYISKSEQS